MRMLPPVFRKIGLQLIKALSPKPDARPPYLRNVPKPHVRPSVEDEYPGYICAGWFPGIRQGEVYACWALTPKDAYLKWQRAAFRVKWAKDDEEEAYRARFSTEPQ